MAETQKFVHITKAGTPFSYIAGYSYWDVLDYVHREYQSAGSNWDRPNMLLRDGEVVVESKLSEHAWNYGQAKYSAIQNAVAEVQQSQKPEWLE